jgi:hypothetical protein
MRTILFRCLWGAGALALSATAASACQSGDKQPSAEGLNGKSAAALSVDVIGGSDVAQVQFSATPVDCATDQPTGAAPTVAISALEDVYAVSGIGGPGNPVAPGSKHLQAEQFLLLSPGCYDFTAQPQKADGQPSADCSSAQKKDVSLLPDQTKEVYLLSQCKGADSAGGDPVVVFNHPPDLVAFDYSPSKFVCAGTTQKICATAKDVDKDPLVFSWVYAGQGAPPPFTVDPMTGPDASGAFSQCIEFTPQAAGNYQFKVDVYDTMVDPDTGLTTTFEAYFTKIGQPHPSHAELTFPSFVESGDACVSPPACAAGAVKACYTGPPGTQGVGECKPGSETCQPGGQWGACTGEVTPVPEIPGNGKDDDCDGVTDPPPPQCQPGDKKSCYDGPAGTAGVGACKAGIQACQQDKQWGPCMNEVTPVVEVCGNGIDDDCNGIDDALQCQCIVASPCYTGPAGTEGVGVCKGGIQSCGAGGQLGSCDGEVTPGPEIPGNGLDDDCDGLTDEVCAPTSTQPCYAGPAGTQGVGACKAGTQVCGANGQWGACNGQVTPSPEVCPDGVDEDCNGQIDDCAACAPGASQACYPGPAGTQGVGVCKAGAQLCSANGQWGACSGAVTPTTEVCGNGFDDDCNGQIDDCMVCVPGATIACYSGPAGTEGVGVCKAGTHVCGANGQWGACSGEVTPGPEVCNGVDDNCNGAVDEQLQNCLCNPAVGSPCAVAGAQGPCAAGHVACNGTCVSDAQPQPESCNGVDDNCNGAVDEGVTGGACSAGVGACAASGQQLCVAGAFVCNAVPGQPQPETCNGIDDNCNGQVDEGLTNGSCTAGTGACLSSGQLACVAGSYLCNAVPGQPQPETCNGIDDNCNGQVDEGLSSGVCTVGVGLCAATGQSLCTAGGYSCNAVPGQPQPEIFCNGVDEDCNGKDDSSPNIGLPCSTGQQGICAVGVYDCTGQCVPSFTPQPEIQCNGVDEDCNGSDECNPCGNGVCDSGETYCTCAADCAMPDPCSDPSIEFNSPIVSNHCAPQEIQCSVNSCTNNGNGTFTLDYTTSLDWLAGCTPEAPKSSCYIVYSVCPP